MGSVVPLDIRNPGNLKLVKKVQFQNKLEIVRYCQAC